MLPKTLQSFFSCIAIGDLVFFTISLACNKIKMNYSGEKNCGHVEEERNDEGETRQV